MAMRDPNNPIIDTRSSFVDGQQPGVSIQPTASQTEATAPAPAGATAAPTSSATSTSPATSTTTTSRTAISSEIPVEYKGSSMAEIIPQLEKYIEQYKPLSKEDLEKLRRRQKAEGVVSGISDAAQSIANLIFTHHYAPNMYNPQEGMSARAKARFERDKAQREADADKYFNYAMTIGKLKDAEKERGLQIWQTEQTLARQDRAYDDSRKDRADDVAFRNKDFDERVRQWQLGYDRDERWHKEEGERWERQFKESIRQFNVSAANERSRIGLEAQRLAHAMKEGQMTFNLGSGNGNVTLSLDRLNAQTVSRIFSTLPDNVRAKVQGDPIMGKDELGNTAVIGYKEPSTEAMLIAIGANVEGSPNTQNAIKEVAGIRKGSASDSGTKMPGVK